MSPKHLMAGALCATLAATGATALDLGNMTEAEAEAFGDAVRDYLIENPEVLMEAIAVLEERQAAEQAAADEALVAANAEAIFEDGHSWVGGAPDGDVVLVEFLDYRCSFCRRAHPEVAELVSSDGSIKKIVKEFPILGEESVEASRFAISVLQTEGPEAYKTISDTLMGHRGAFTREAMARIARTAGLDAEAILAEMDSEEVSAVIRRNHALAERLQISGTPTFVMGDRMVRGYVPLEGMREVVAEVRAD